MLVVHHLENSRSQRVLWLLEELGVPYEVKRYARNTETMLAPPELRAVHPLGKSPVITDDGTTVAESGAIVEYLVERYGNGRLIPAAGTPERLRYTYWLHYAEGSAMPPLLLMLVFNRVETAPMPFFVKPIARQIAGRVKGTFIEPQVKLHFDFMETELGKSTWFALGMTLVIATGGLTDFADGNAARIFRVSDGGKLYSVRLRDLIKRGDITANAEMRPGDILIIPQSWF